MDHLPTPQNARPPITVPRLEVIPYDFVRDQPPDTAYEHFRLFPDRHAFGTDGELLPNQDPTELARFVQSWLYFGLISAFFNRRINLIHFTTKEGSDDHQESGKTWVTSTYLNTLLRRLELKEQKKYEQEEAVLEAEKEESDPSRKKTKKNQRAAMKASREHRHETRKNMCWHAYNTVRQLEESDVGRSPELAAICLSVQLLAVTLIGCNPQKSSNISDQDGDYEEDYSRLRFWPWTAIEIMTKVREMVKKLNTEQRRLLGSYSISSPDYGIGYPTVFLDQYHWESNLLRKTMVENGWCPSELDNILATQDLTVYYLSQLSRLQTIPLPHNQCSRDACVARNSPSHPPYRRAHTTDVCQCRALSVDTDALCKIIEDGDIPLIYLKAAAHGTFSLGLTRMGSLSNYVAISHVWSDGLGTSNGNSLFQCQLESMSESFLCTPLGEYDRLRTIFRLFQLTPSFLASKVARCGKRGPLKQLFWMDTLCIPVAHATDPPARVARINALKRRAIDSMNMVYYGATHVLILDGEIRKINLAGAPRCEIAARIAYSHWNSRCWTLQEATLGSAWLLRFSDDLLGRPRAENFWQRVGDSMERGDSWRKNHVLKYLEEPDSLLSGFETTSSIPSIAVTVEDHIRKRLVKVLKVPMQLFSDWDGMFQRTKDSVENECLDSSNFSCIWNLLAHRSTSEERDVPAIFANLLNFNLHQLTQQFPDELGIMGILWNIEAVPLALLFNQGSRLNPHEKHRNRWVPTKLSKIKCKTVSMTWKDAGLHFTNESGEEINLVIFEWPQQSISDKIIVQTSQGPIYVRVLREVHDKMRMEPGLQYALVVDIGGHEDPDGGDSAGVQGALLRVQDYTKAEKKDADEQQRELRISAIYDCPIRVQFADRRNAFDEAPVADTAEVWNHAAKWEVSLQVGTYSADVVIFDAQWLMIQADANDSRSLLARREDFAEVHYFGVALNLVMKALALIEIGVRITIAARLGWHNLAPFGRAALLLWVFQRSVYVGNLFGILIPTVLTKAYFTVDRLRNGGLTALDYAYVLIPFSFQIWGIAAMLTQLVDWHVGWHLNMLFYSAAFVEPRNFGERFTRSMVVLAIRSRRLVVWLRRHDRVGFRFR